MKPWASAFTAAGVSGGNFTTDGEVAPEDIIAGRVLEVLQANAKLVEIFGDRIEKLESRAPFDFRTFPRLQVYCSSTTETQSPTRVDANKVRVYIGIRFDALNVSVVTAYGATISSVRKVIAVALKANKSLKVQINGTTDVPLAMELETGQTSWLWDPSPTDARIAGTLETEWVYRVHVDHDTQRIINLQTLLG
jgi:hypothetical protein